ncbi:Nucleobindin-2, partial [Desmophyllum pertusum]
GTKLDELKRQEVERTENDTATNERSLNGLKEREYWNPLFDDDNPNFLDLRILKSFYGRLLCPVLWNRHQSEHTTFTLMQMADLFPSPLAPITQTTKKVVALICYFTGTMKRWINKIKYRRDEFKRHEKWEQGTQKKGTSQRMDEKARKETEVKLSLSKFGKKTDGLDAKDFDPRTFFQTSCIMGSVIDTNGDDYLDTGELEALFC